MHTKPLIYGFITGVVLVFVSALGLVIGLVEFLQPALSPGTELLRGRVDDLPVNPLIVGILLNGLIYAVLFGMIASTPRMFESSVVRSVAIFLILFGFLTVTGTIGDILSLLSSPNPWWIFTIGA